MAETIELAENIMEARKGLDKLWEACEDPTIRKKIRRQMNALDIEVMRLISINIKKRGEDYDKATNSLAGANKKIQKALADLERIADAIGAVASAIDLIAEVKPA